MTMRVPMDEATRLAELLTPYHSAEGEERARLRRELVELIESNFQADLRRALVSRFGRRVDDKAQDASVRFSMVLNEFFVRVLEGRHDGLSRAETLHHLRALTSRALTNQVIDHLRRRRRGRELEEAAMQDDLIAQHTHELGERFQRHTALDLDAALERLELWEERGEPFPEFATVLRHRYVDGMTYEEIAMQLGRTRKACEHLRVRAIDALRQELNP